MSADTLRPIRGPMYFWPIDDAVLMALVIAQVRSGRSRQELIEWLATMCHPFLAAELVDRAIRAA